MNAVLSEYYAARAAHDKALKNLDSETLRIVKVITKFFKKKDYWWSYDYYENADDYEPLPRRLEDGYFSMPIHISVECDSGVWYYNEAIPVKFYDMTDEEIVAYLQAEVEEHKKKEAEVAAALAKKVSDKKAKSDAIKASALAKLTTAERKALKV